MYDFHITFSDGSNPYWHFPTTYKKHYAALRQWKRNYAMLETMRFKRKDGGYTAYYNAIPLSAEWKATH